MTRFVAASRSAADIEAIVNSGGAISKNRSGSLRSIARPSAAAQDGANAFDHAADFLFVAISAGASAIVSPTPGDHILFREGPRIAS